MPFEKGVSGNLSGRTPLPAEIRAIKHLTSQEFYEVFASVRNLTIGEAKAIMKEADNHSVFYIAMLQCMLKVATKGDYVMLDKILDRIIGKVKEVKELISGEDEQLRVNRLLELLEKMNVQSK